MDADIALIQAVVMFEDDDDDEVDDVFEEEGRLRILTDIESWKRLGDPGFEEHFRMNRHTFEMLLVAVGRHLETNNRLLRESRKGLDFSLMMVLWILASPDTFRSVGVKFGVAKGVVHFHYKYIIEALREMAPLYIQWPNALEKELISEHFEAHYGYPSVIGCIDGCHIQMTAPLEQPQRYVDRHHNYSILLQGVCDHRLVFRDVFVGQPGSVGDKRTFRRSPLGCNILVREGLTMDKHLLGDGGYTLTSKLLIPYRDHGNLNRRQRIHNRYLSRCRASIERAFALLKGKWRRLKFFPNYCIHYAVDHILACVVLHNFILLEGEEYQAGDMIEDHVERQHVDHAELLEEAKADGILRRDFIAALLAPEE